MFLLGFARLARTSTFTSLAVCTAHVSGGKRLPPSRANTANSAIIRRENRLTRGVLLTRHKFSSSLWRKRPAPMTGTAGYRSLRSLCASLAAFHFKIRTSVNADALAHALGAGRSSKPIRPAQFPRIGSAFSAVSPPALRGLWERRCSNMIFISI